MPAQTLYFGGGTPSLLDAKEIAAVISQLRVSGRLAAQAEITLEANPEDLSSEMLHALRASGVNRLSLGIQSFEAETLRWLGRKHSSEDARKVILDARAAGFEKLSVDLIVGVPGEKRPQIGEQIQWLSGLVGHISVYLLTVEATTPLVGLIDQGKRQAPSEDDQADAFEWVQHEMQEAGYGQYEISSYAKVGEESRHNRLYWAKGSYLGLGPGAHSMRLCQDGSVVRRHNRPDYAAWAKKPASLQTEEETLLPEQAFLEALAFGIRDMAAGIDLSALHLRHQVGPVKGLTGILSQMKELGWIEERGSRIHLTPLGARFADAVAREVLSCDLTRSG